MTIHRLALGIPGCVAVTMLASYFGGIDVAKLHPSRESVTYTDRNGSALGTLLGADSSHAHSVPLEAVAPALRDAMVAAEDARFWHHGAIDVPALLRAARDFAIYGEARSGGSTIAMQLARLLYPTPATIRGKIAQIATAQRIAIASSKSAILEAYVNRVPMGGNVYGVEAAARTYFGEPAATSTSRRRRCSRLSRTIRQHLEPDADWNALRARQHFILQRMVALG